MKSAKVENGVNGISDMEGKAVRVAASECGQRVSFNWFELAKALDNISAEKAPIN
jgi:hypothetical protein